MQCLEKFLRANGKDDSSRLQTRARLAKGRRFGDTKLQNDVISRHQFQWRYFNTEKKVFLKTISNRGVLEKLLGRLFDDNNNNSEMFLFGFGQQKAR